MVKGMKCPKCGGKRIMLAGFMPLVGGKKQRVKCWDCGRSSWLDDAVKAVKPSDAQSG